MIARCRKRRWQACKDAFAIVVDRRYFSMERLRRADHFAAKNLPDGLMPQTDTQKRYGTIGAGGDQVQTNAGMIRVRRAGGNKHGIGCACQCDFHRDLVIAVDFNVLSQIAQILDQIVGKTVIIIDKQDHAQNVRQGFTEGKGIAILGIMTKPPKKNMTTVQFIVIAAILMVLADRYLFGGTRSYIEEAKQSYHAQHPAVPLDVEEMPPPTRIMPGDGDAYFEAPADLEQQEESHSIPTGAPEEAAQGQIIAPQEDPSNIQPTPAPLPPVVTPGPFKGKAKVAIIIDDLGMDLKRSRQIIDLPAPITLAFLPYGTKTRDYATIGKEKGHTLIIHTPMEAMDGKLNIGPNGLRANMDAAAFTTNFEGMLKSFDGYGGINNHMGSRLTQDKVAMARVMGMLKARDLYFVDSKTIGSSIAAQEARRAGVPYAERDVFLDHVDSRAFVDSALVQVERKALRDGSAIAIGHPKDSTIAGLKAWIPTLAGKGIELVPVSRLLIKPRAVDASSEDIVEPVAASAFVSKEKEQGEIIPPEMFGPAEEKPMAAAPAQNVPSESPLSPPPQLPAIY